MVGALVATALTAATSAAPAAAATSAAPAAETARAGTNPAARAPDPVWMYGRVEGCNTLVLKCFEFWAPNEFDNVRAMWDCCKKIVLQGKCAKYGLCTFWP